MDKSETVNRDILDWNLNITLLNRIFSGEGQRQDAKSKMIKSCRIFCSMIILFHPLHICSWRYNICSPNQPSLKCHRNQDTMTTTVTMYLKVYFNDCTNPGEKVTNLGKD